MIIARKITLSIMAGIIMVGCISGTNKIRVNADSGDLYTKQAVAPYAFSGTMPKTMVAYDVKVNKSTGKKTYKLNFPNTTYYYGTSKTMKVVDPNKYKSVNGPSNNKFRINYGKDTVTLVKANSEPVSIGVCEHTKGAKKIKFYINGKAINLDKYNSGNTIMYKGKALAKIGGKNRNIIVMYGEVPTAKTIKSTGTLKSTILYNANTGDIELDTVVCNSSAGGTKRTIYIAEK